MSKVYRVPGVSGINRNNRMGGRSIGGQGKTLRNGGNTISGSLWSLKRRVAIVAQLEFW